MEMWMMMMMKVVVMAAAAAATITVLMIMMDTATICFVISICQKVLPAWQNLTVYMSHKQGNDYVRTFTWMTWWDNVTRLPHDSRTWWGMGLCCGPIWSRNHHWKLMKTPTSATTAQRLAPTSFIAIIISTVIIGIKKLLEPLKEFKIVLKPAFNQFIYGDNLQWRILILL